MVRLSLSLSKIQKISNIVKYSNISILYHHKNSHQQQKQSRRYDSRTTTFSPEGRLFQVEYAMEAINNAASALGLLCSDGIVLAVEKRVQSKLLEKPKTSEKMYKIDNHIACAVAGLTSDANILLNEARLLAQKHRYRYREPQNVESMIKALCNMKQSYTQFGGLRPFGVSFLIAGWDKHFGFQLYLSDPSGNYGGWNAAAIGNNNQIAKDKLKSTYDQKMSVEEGLKYSVGVLSKTMDIIPTSDRMEFATITLNGGEVEFKVLSKDETNQLLESAKKDGDDDDDGTTASK